AGRRFNMIMLGTFALAAAILAAVGVYGIVAFGVTQRSHEIGVRVALGARPACGLAGALAASRVLRGLLFGVGAADGLTLAGAALVTLAVGALACVAPIRRARRLDAAAV